MGYTTLPTYDELYKKNLEAYKTQQDEAIAESDKVFNAQKEFAQKSFDTSVKNTEASYDEAHQKNELQKYINEKQLQENMANLGLTDSGLNRTQQTAVQLSYANNRADINRQRQSAVDALTLELQSNLVGIETNKSNAAASIKSSYQQMASNAAIEEYTANYDYLIEQQKLAAEAAENAKKSQTLYYTTNTFKLAEDGKSKIRVYTASDGNTYEIAEGTNPYTRESNTTGTSGNAVAIKGIKTKNETKYGGYGAFSNGYQPKGVVFKSNGGYVDYGEVKNSGYDKINFEGKDVTVWKTTKNGETRFWFWSGIKNQYIQIKLRTSTNDPATSDWITV